MEDQWHRGLFNLICPDFYRKKWFFVLIGIKELGVSMWTQISARLPWDNSIGKVYQHLLRSPILRVPRHSSSNNIIRTILIDQIWQIMFIPQKEILLQHGSLPASERPYTCNRPSYLRTRDLRNGDDPPQLEYLKLVRTFWDPPQSEKIVLQSFINPAPTS